MSTHDLNAGALAPVADEVNIIDPVVIGNVPEDLRGTLVRNGPNPLSGHFTGNDVLSWWPEAAMLHGMSFRDGRATSYRNRWARTRNWAQHWASEGAESLFDTNPNVNVIQHAGEILALAEGGVPLAINAELETLGASRFHSGFANGVTAHPKIDPVSSELIWFRADWNQPWLRYGVTGADGTQQFDTEIDLPAPSMMHDIAITATHSILLDMNVAYDFSLLSRGYRIPIRWQKNKMSRFGVFPRQGGAVIWIEIEPCFIQHVVNAYDAERSTIVLDAVRYPWYLRLDSDGKDFLPNPLAVLWRYVINAEKGTVVEQQVGDVAIELPRINETLTGRRYRYLYAVTQPTVDEMRGIVRYDLQSGSTQHHVIAKGDQNSEPLFVARPDAQSEDDGWLLVCVYRRETDSSDVMILDAGDIASAPVATVVLPRRIPAGFHGAWLPDF